MNEIVISVLLVFGAALIFIAAVGLLRMPDLFTRMSCNAKAATFGISILLLALAMYFGELDVVSRALATIGFIVLTTPVASHRIGQVAYLEGISLWEGTIADEMGEERKKAAAQSPGASEGPT